MDVPVFRAGGLVSVLHVHAIGRCRVQNLQVIYERERELIDFFFIWSSNAGMWFSLLGHFLVCWW